jgi:hypothetical protein
MQVAGSERERELKQQLKQHIDDAAVLRNSLRALLQCTNSAVLAFADLAQHLPPEQQRLFKDQNYELALAISKAQQGLAGLPAAAAGAQPAAGPPAAAMAASGPSETLEGVVAEEGAAVGAEQIEGAAADCDAAAAAEAVEAAAAAVQVRAAEEGAADKGAAAGAASSPAGAAAAIDVHSATAAALNAANTAEDAAAVAGAGAALATLVPAEGVAAAAAAAGHCGRVGLQQAFGKHKAAPEGMLTDQQQLLQQDCSSNSSRQRQQAVALCLGQVQLQLEELGAFVELTTEGQLNVCWAGKKHFDIAARFWQTLESHGGLFHTLQVPGTDSDLRYAAISGLTALRCLNMRTCKGFKVGDYDWGKGKAADVLAPLSALQQLTQLELPGLRRVQLQHLQLPQLLQLKFNTFDCASGGLLQLSQLTRLTRLDMLGLHWKPEDMLPGNLQALHMQTCRMQGCMQLLLPLARLVRLELRIEFWCTYQKAEAKKFAQLRTLPSLTDLQLEYSGLDAKAAAAAAHAWPLLPLRSLSVRAEAVVAAGVFEQLSSLRSLTDLQVLHCNANCAAQLASRMKPITALKQLTISLDGPCAVEDVVQLVLRISKIQSCVLQIDPSYDMSYKMVDAVQQVEARLAQHLPAEVMAHIHFLR